VSQQNHSAGSGISQVGCGMQILRGSTSIYVADNSARIGQSFAAVSGTISGLANMAHLSYLDSPATTSAITYQPYIKADSGGTTAYNGTGTAVLTLLEITSMVLLQFELQFQRHKPL